MLAPSPRYSARFVAAFTRLFWPVACLWFRPRAAGLNRVPPPPCLFVANHSAYGVFEILVMLAIYASMIRVNLHISTIIITYGTFVSSTMLVVILWHRHNQRKGDSLHLIGMEKN